MTAEVVGFASSDHYLVSETKILAVIGLSAIKSIFVKLDGTGTSSAVYPNLFISITVGLCCHFFTRRVYVVRIFQGYFFIRQRSQRIDRYQLRMGRSPHIPYCGLKKFHADAINNMLENL